ncbi:MAG TPA: alpha/beta fold hydrolase [Chloroflexota bacterium]|jgi:dienelactone hydrolase|nr:alpha/beta fold hydrolase [Chloroflexota bacterium]
MVTLAPAQARPFEEVRAIMLERAGGLKNPFAYTRADEVERVLNQLHSVEREAWAEAFMALAEPYETGAADAEARGDHQAARDLSLIAYDYCHVARYPAPNSPGKLRAYRRSQENFHRAARYFEPPLERVEMPFNGRPGEGSVSIGLLRKPTGVERPPVAVIWGGIDAFKEERKPDDFLEVGLAVLAIDMPGVADAPLAGSEDAERLWDAVFDWIASRPDLDAQRVGIVGGSTGGYWAAKVAHTHRDRVRAAVDHGGCIHHAFSAEWIAEAQRGEYPFELAETLACAFGRSTYEEWVAYAPRLSLVRQGVLDQPCAPLLAVNGANDSVFPIDDVYVLLEHGGPKWARVVANSGHMGHPVAMPTIVSWLKEHLS